MHLRSALFAVMLGVTAFPTAHAQAPETSAQTAPSPEAVAAARDFFEAFLFESNMITQLVDAIAVQMLPEMRNTVLNSPLSRNTTEARRQALAAFVDTLPEILRREFAAEMVLVADNASRRLASHLSAEEMSQAAAFMRSADGRSALQAMIAAYSASSTKGAEEPSIAETEALAAFDATPAGQAFTREEEAFNRIIDEELAVATARITPRLQLIVLAGFCAALEDDCPQHFRDAIGAAQPA